MAIEPGDVSYSTWAIDPNPVPVREPNDMHSGTTKFLRRDMNEPIFHTVGDTFSYQDLKVAGKKPIKVTMYEQMFDVDETLKEIQVAMISGTDKGVTFTIRQLTEEMRGNHTFIFEATTEGGLERPRARIYLIVQGKTSGG